MASCGRNSRSGPAKSLPSTLASAPTRSVAALISTDSYSLASSSSSSSGLSESSCAGDFFSRIRWVSVHVVSSQLGAITAGPHLFRHPASDWQISMAVVRSSSASQASMMLGTTTSTSLRTSLCSGTLTGSPGCHGCGELSS